MNNVQKTVQIFYRLNRLAGKKFTISACGFANTAMILAEKGFIPHVFAAVIRVAAVPRALVAFEQ
ncbi:MAG: methanol---5-hydroxybenzimidazolylcobamide Co-methyltransferase, partial [Eubacteriaceae bacterium]|nr:methanol---5-hydroxybenzimidazolylcobamide Co-methyltransferase [Eubacteriaceae bacterium]